MAVSLLHPEVMRRVGAGSLTERTDNRQLNFAPHHINLSTSKFVNPTHEELAFSCLATMRAVTVAMVDEGVGPDLLVKQSDELVDNLCHHRISAVIHVAAGRRLDTSSVLLEVIAERKADLAFMGGYDHSRLHEWFLGEVSYNLLR